MFKRKFQKVRNDFRKKVPLLTFAQVRRHRIPLHEAMLLELEENKNPVGLKFFKRLCETDKSEDELTKDHKLLKHIFEILELYGTDECPEQAIHALRDLVEEFVNRKKQISVLRGIYENGFEVIESYGQTKTKIGALFQNLYGKFAHEVDKDYEKAFKLFRVAHEVISTFTEEDCEIARCQNMKIFKLIVVQQLCNTAIELSKKIGKTKPAEALERSQLSLDLIMEVRKTTDSSLKTLHLEIASNVAVGDCLSELKDFSKALTHYEAAKESAASHEFHRETCKAFMKMAECKRNLKQHEAYEVDMQNARNVARKAKLMDIVSMVPLEMAKYFYQIGSFERAKEAFEDAHECFMKAKDRYMILYCRYMLAWLKKIDGFQDLLDAIMKSEVNSRYLYRIINWYDRRVQIQCKYHESCEHDPADEDLDLFFSKYFDQHGITEIATASKTTAAAAQRQ